MSQWKISFSENVSQFLKSSLSCLQNYFEYLCFINDDEICCNLPRTWKNAFKTSMTPMRNENPESFGIQCPISMWNPMSLFFNRTFRLLAQILNTILQDSLAAFFLNFNREPIITNTSNSDPHKFRMVIVFALNERGSFFLKKPLYFSIL